MQVLRLKEQLEHGVGRYQLERDEARREARILRQELVWLQEQAQRDERRYKAERDSAHAQIRREASHGSMGLNQLKVEVEEEMVRLREERAIALEERDMALDARDRT